jgi:hypothetical protein
MNSAAYKKQQETERESLGLPRYSYKVNRIHNGTAEPPEELRDVVKAPDNGVADNGDQDPADHWKSMESTKDNTRNSKM